MSQSVSQDKLLYIYIKHNITSKSLNQTKNSYYRGFCEIELNKYGSNLVWYSKSISLNRKCRYYYKVINL